MAILFSFFCVLSQNIVFFFGGAVSFTATSRHRRRPRSATIGHACVPLMVDVGRIRGSCAECLRDDLCGSDFILGDLRRFLEERQTLRRAVDIRNEWREGSLTQVAGKSLRCRRCVVSGRDRTAGLKWRAAEVTVAFETRPFGLVRMHDTSAYIVSKAEGLAARAGIQPGWRVTAVGGTSVIGESCELVRQAIAAGVLPLSVSLEVPDLTWPACGRCGHACRPGQSCLREQCAHADGARECEGVGQPDQVEVADSWEDAF